MRAGNELGTQCRCRRGPNNENIMRGAADERTREWLKEPVISSVGGIWILRFIPLADRAHDQPEGSG